MRFPFFLRKKSSGIFIPTRNGFELAPDSVTKGSFNDVAEQLGYHTDQVKSYFKLSRFNRTIDMVAFEVFSTRIAFVITKDNVHSLSKCKVKRYIKGFDPAWEYNSYNTEGILKDGIENKSLHIDFLSKVLLIKDADDNGVFHVDAIGGYLYFNDGYLTDFQPSDGLNKWAKGWKQQNLDFISDYEACAKKHWGSRSDKIIQEINAQADAYANVPGGWKNSYIKLHRTDAGTINFVMLRVCHHNEPITLPYFKEINHGRYGEVPVSEAGNTQYLLGNFLYTFNQNGDLVDRLQV